jgi:hypothetical protein
MRPSPRPFRPFRWLLSLLLLLAVLHGGLWLFATSRLLSTFTGWQQQMQAAGFTVQAGAPRRGGWPLVAALTLPRLTIATPSGLRWQAPEVRLLLRPQAPTELVVEVPGAQAFHFDGVPTLHLTAQRFILTAPLATRFPTAPFTLEAEGLQLGPDGGALAVGALQASFRADPKAERAQAALSLQLAARAIILPAGLPGTAVLGREIARLRLRAALSGPLPATGTPAGCARAWRDGGGSLAISRLALAWGPVTADAEGSFGLDSALQPSGAATVRIGGLDALLQAAVAAGQMTEPAARAARALLTLLAPPSPAGGTTELAVPLQLRDRTLAAGPFTLLRVPRFRWSGEEEPAKVAP